MHEGQDRTRGNRQGPAEKGHSTWEAGHRLGTPELSYPGISPAAFGKSGSSQAHVLSWTWELEMRSLAFCLSLAGRAPEMNFWLF